MLGLTVNPWFHTPQDGPDSVVDVVSSSRSVFLNLPVKKAEKLVALRDKFIDDCVEILNEE
jgi:hypothetical protein